MFIDETVITVISGNGGDGAATFRREKFVQFGGPNGGDGGKGGDIIFKTNPNMTTLVSFRNLQKFYAGNGEKGSSSRCTGKSGDDLIIEVPVGTIVRDFETNEILLDLSNENEEVVFLKGGDGGRGNVHFKNSIRKAPKMAESGKEGITLKIKLELKLLADIALVGFPSVGKSSFINKVSSAKSKVASYHFTTLKPKLGVVKINDEESFVIADIPGLIEGASDGLGLGYKFLKHIERCKAIIHIVDISGVEGRDPKEDFVKINKELKKYSEKLYNKKQIVFANKMDLLYDNSKYDEFVEFVKSNGVDKVYSGSILLNDGLKEIIFDAYNMAKEIPREPISEIRDLEEILPKIFKKKEDWIITKVDDNTFDVSGQIIDNVLKKYVLIGEDGIIQFLHIMRNLGMEEKLQQAGVKEGDTVNIEGYSFEYVL